MKEIQLGGHIRGSSPRGFAIVDDEDFEELNEYHWCINSSGYADNSFCGRMHRFILKAKKGEICDHINGDKLDNRKKNLRICNITESLRNRPIQRNNTSGYKGVSWNKKKKKWCSLIMVDKRNLFQGYFSDKRKAALAYNKAAKIYHKEFARLNVI